jgi:putative SOS response-associated peptidase YedK
MCGRASQTLRTAREAGSNFGASYPNECDGPVQDDNKIDAEKGRGKLGDSDCYNMCPGMNAFVIKNEDEKIIMKKNAWGLITKHGSAKNPLPKGNERMSLHFQNLMFNARSDTLFSKPTFSKLATQKKSCIVVLDGYFEWKRDPLGSGKGKKQPYFVYGKDEEGSKCQERRMKPLMLAGLWTSVATGIPSEPKLETFTILTTEPSKQIEWLHGRMPIVVWEMATAMQWLENPSPAVLQSLEEAARKNNDGFGWHMVSAEMSNLKYQGKKAIQAIKAPDSVLSFFSKKSKDEQNSTGVVRGAGMKVESKSSQAIGPISSPKRLKRELSSQEDGITSKKANKNLITGFFHKRE